MWRRIKCKHVLLKLVSMKVGKAFYKTYVILFYYEVLKHYGISQKGSREALAHEVILMVCQNT